MNMIETTRLLAKVQACDGRPVGEAMVLAWQETLADVPYALAMRAVTVHYQESVAFLMPAHIITLVERLRDIDRRAGRDQAHDARLSEHDKRPTLGDLPANTRKAVAAVVGSRRAHNLTIRRRDMAGTSWAYSCACGVNPMDQAWPDKDTARARGGDHIPVMPVIGSP